MLLHCQYTHTHIIIQSPNQHMLCVNTHTLSVSTHILSIKSILYNAPYECTSYHIITRSLTKSLLPLPSLLPFHPPLPPNHQQQHYITPLCGWHGCTQTLRRVQRGPYATRHRHRQKRLFKHGSFSNTRVWRDITVAT